jgi:hypothetical protein
MKNNYMWMSVIGALTCVAVTLSGCQDSGSSREDYSNIFESDVVKLVNFSMELEKDKFGVISKVMLNGRIENIVDRMINLNITAIFFDENDGILGDKVFTIYGLRNKPNPGYSTTFTIIYEEENVSKVDHVRIYAYRKNLRYPDL